MLQINDKVITKKNHPCKNNEWTCVRTGADIKLRCDKCNKVVMFTLDEFKKSVKTVNGKKYE